jgi:hypothetical protein
MKTTKTVQLLPNWKTAATIYIMAFEANCGGRTAAKEGIIEMAEKFDAYIESNKPCEEK